MNSYRVAKRSLKDTSAFADEVVSHLPVGLIATDRSGRVTFFNASAEKMTGLDKQLVLNQNPDKQLPPDLCGVQKGLAQGEIIIEKEMVCRFKENQPVPFSISATRIINEDGEFVGQVLILRDLSEIHRLQEEVQRQEKLAAMGGLAAGVAHEVRNPLSSIKALATYFAEQFDEGSDSNEAAKVMVQEVDRLNRAITELLEFSRPTDLKREVGDIGALITKSIQLIQQDAANQKVDIDLQIDDAICAALFDPDRLTQCLLNLYLNAIQAMPGGGVLTVKCAAGEAETILITISDTGKGISSGNMNKIFDPYYTTKSKGTGLGLAIVQKFIVAHDGRISVKSTNEQGASFLITLPCKPKKIARGPHDNA